MPLRLKSARWTPTSVVRRVSKAGSLVREAGRVVVRGIVAVVLDIAADIVTAARGIGYSMKVNGSKVAGCRN